MKRFLLKFDRLLQQKFKCQHSYVVVRHFRQRTEEKESNDTLTSNKIRQLFLDYFVKERNHTYIHSSPIFLNHDPTLLFVNAGMNQFRSLLLNKTQPGHPLHNLKRAANSQKCIRLSGKHNDLSDVGQDLHHHTFFEMLGNWSFGDYTKKEACVMAWELLTKIYGIKPDRLYMTYFGGDQSLGLSPDVECKNIWLEIGVHPDHIFPFGAKDNFWEMADKGPCGPCTEIHFDYLPNSSTMPPAQRINADRADMIEVWNLVFIQYNREKNGKLQNIPHLNVDTGMGFERLTAILQGTMSNYDTDIFQPLFQAIEKNFKVKPYEGHIGSNDVHGVDTAYRILADHSRMFTVAIADGLFPDIYDAGHVLRKIIRRAAYAANRVMKSRPGVLSSLIPHVAESLSFFPEVQNNIDEIIQIVNEEEKLFHQVINRGRKARNKMMSESGSNILNGQNIWELNKHYGLEENVIQDLAMEIKLKVDWDGYKKFTEEKNHLKASNSFTEKSDALLECVNILRKSGIQCSNDSFKYNYNTGEHNYGVKNITAQVVAIFKDNSLIEHAEDGFKCTIVTDKTNFYSEAGGQESDVGEIQNESFSFNVNKVHSHLGYVFHEGIVSSGELNLNSFVRMSVNKDHRRGCSCNHTATHILNSALRKLFPYTAQRSSYVGPQNLRLGFSSKAALSDNQIDEIEDFVNHAIKQKLNVSKSEMPFEELLSVPHVTLLHGEEYPDVVKVIFIGNESKPISIEPCCGTHVDNTADLGSFAFTPVKSQGGTTRVLNSVTGKQAVKFVKNGEALWKKILHLQSSVDAAVENININKDELHLLLKEVKKVLHECHLKIDISSRMQRKCENKMKDIKLKLTDLIDNLEGEKQAIQSEMENKLNIDSLKILTILEEANFPKTNDIFKYDNFKQKVHCIKPISASIIAIFQNNQLVKEVCHGHQCQVITDKTNFYAEGDDQACDIGLILNKDFVFQVSHVHKMNEYVLHDGWVETGNLSHADVHLLVNLENRLACSQNHTALHLLNSVLKQVLPYAFQRSAFAGTSMLQLCFSSKIPLSEEQLKHIECQINSSLQDNLKVLRSHVPLSQLKDVPVYKASLIKELKKDVPVVAIMKDESVSEPVSVEPCCGTHVSSTSDIHRFILTTYKTTKTMEKMLQAVTGQTALAVQREGEAYDKQMTELENQVSYCLEKNKIDHLELWDCLKEVKMAKQVHYTKLPLLMFKTHQKKLTQLTIQLTTVIDDFVQEGFAKVKSEMQSVLKASVNDQFVIHKLAATGDGKKIINYALDCVQDKPAMFFVCEGHKCIICSCSVPKSKVTSSFSALLWIQPLAELIEGHTRTTTKDPELHFSVISNRTDKIDEAMRISKEFVQSKL